MFSRSVLFSAEGRGGKNSSYAVPASLSVPPLFPSVSIVSIIDHGRFPWLASFRATLIDVTLEDKSAGIASMLDVAKLEQGETVGRINDDVKNLIPRCRCRFRIGIRIRWKKESYIYLSFLPLKFSEKLVTNPVVNFLESDDFLKRERERERIRI